MAKAGSHMSCWLHCCSIAGRTTDVIAESQTTGLMCVLPMRHGNKVLRTLQLIMTGRVLGFASAVYCLGH